MTKELIDVNKILDKIKKRSDIEFRKRKVAFFVCPECHKKISEIDRNNHEFLHSPETSSKLDIRELVQAIIAIIGVIILIGWLWVVASLILGPGPEKGERYPGDCIMPSGDPC